MKKKFYSILICILLIATCANSAFSKTGCSTELSSAIRLYKAHNYSQCYVKLQSIVKADPSNALAYYYLAMTDAQIGKKEDAISNYERVISLTSANSNIGKYAQKGKTCLETPEKCHETTQSEAIYTLNSKAANFTKEAQSEYEKLKIENMMREMNRSNDVPSDKFKNYKDFSSMNTNEMPSNDDIVAAIRILQKAGISSNVTNQNTNPYDWVSVLNGVNSGANIGENPYSSYSNSMTPQMIQAMLTNNMSLGF